MSFDNYNYNIDKTVISNKMYLTLVYIINYWEFTMYMKWLDVFYTNLNKVATKIGNEGEKLWMLKL